MILQIFLILIFVLLLILIISYISYRMAFYAPKRVDPDLVPMPVGEQYDKQRPGIAKSVDEMLARPFEPVSITSHDGKKLYGRYYHAADNAPVQIFFHGYKSTAILDCCGGSKLAAKQMRDVAEIILLKNGEQVSETYYASIEGCAQPTVADATHKNNALVKAMMAYGDSAKVYFG